WSGRSMVSPRPARTGPACRPSRPVLCSGHATAEERADKECNRSNDAGGSRHERNPCRHWYLGIQAHRSEGCRSVRGRVTGDRADRLRGDLGSADEWVPNKLFTPENTPLAAEFPDIDSLQDPFATMAFALGAVDRLGFAICTDALRRDAPEL